MKLETLKQALRSIPQTTEETPGPEEISDVLGAAAEFSRLLRKAGIQQSRDVREILASVQDPEQIREAWQREQQRAAASEHQLRKLVEVLIATLDILDRMLGAFTSAQMKEWELQTTQAIDVCLHNAEKVGLVPLGVRGEPFDVAIHDLTREVPRQNKNEVRVGAVITRGYALNGKIIRRATVDYVT